MSNLLIAETLLVEKYKQAIPELERVLSENVYCYLAGSLILNIPEPGTDRKYTSIDIKPIDNYASEIIRRGLYLASRIFINGDKTSSCFCEQAEKNIKIYEQTHGRELEPSGTDEIS